MNFVTCHLPVGRGFIR